MFVCFQICISMCYFLALHQHYHHVPTPCSLLLSNLLHPLFLLNHHALCQLHRGGQVQILAEISFRPNFAVCSMLTLKRICIDDYGIVMIRISRQ